jgi:prepilin-type N-terminal cleavage/methylation domain-containing protein
MKAMILNRKALRSNSKKGFTLVEVIVVLVILAILMAIAVPSLTGYIDKARKDGQIARAASAKTAVQLIVSQAYGSSNVYTLTDGRTLTFTNWTTAPSGTVVTGVDSDAAASLAKAAALLTGSTFDTITITNVSGNQITGLTVKLTATGPTATYTTDAQGVGSWALS